jgi:2,3-bisphosphoglycerate-independent phosphoglycerate mutase
MDGFGENPEIYGNAIDAARPLYLDELKKYYPSTTLGSSGLDVGLPRGQMGNSEVGHLNMGAGRVVYQSLTRISKAIEDGSILQNEAITKLMDTAKAGGKRMHTFGLLSDGGVHSHIEHLFGIIKMAKARGLDNIYIHLFLDGRDTPPHSGAGYIKELKDFIEKEQFGVIASVMGRYYAMDRDNRWERVAQAYDALIGEGAAISDALEYVRQSYNKNETDEFVRPATVFAQGAPVGAIQKGDSVLFFNFRPDRARELTRAFIYDDFDKFARKTGYLDVLYAGMTEYDAEFTNILTAFPPEDLTNTLGEVLAARGIPQLRIAETEKYAHVTFFFNGGVEAPNPGEDRVLIPSPKISTYDLKPEMSAYEVAAKAVELIKSKKYGVMILNFANCDMVGHTGVFSAATEAVKTVDNCVREVVEALLKENGIAIVVSDHGNADKMYENDGSPFTAHTTSHVPFILITKENNYTLREGGKLCDIAPTILELLNIPQPEEMTGKSLIANK